MSYWSLLKLSLFWCNFSTKETYFGQKYSPKNKYFFSSFNNDRNLSLDNKTKDYVDRISGGQVNSLKEVTQLRCIYQVLKFPNKLLNIIVKVEFTPFWGCPQLDHPVTCENINCYSKIQIISSIKSYNFLITCLLWLQRQQNHLWSYNNNNLSMWTTHDEAW